MSIGHQIDDVTLNFEVPRLKEEVERLRGELTINKHLLDSAVSGIQRHKQALEKAKVALLTWGTECLDPVENCPCGRCIAITTINQVLDE